MKGISTNLPCTTKAACIKKAGYDFIFRYYAKNRRNKKIIKKEEARAIAAAGLQLAIVFQNTGDKISYFTYLKGKKDGEDAYHYAQEMKQPANSAIYFSVDFDPYLVQIQNGIQDYFKGVLEGFNSSSNNRPIYQIGVYGSGRTCGWLRNHLSFVRYAWLALPPKWAHRTTYKDWNVKQSFSRSTLCGMPGGLKGAWELNEAQTDDFGQFVPSVD